MILIETIFFDVDGTLIDATKDIVKAVNHTLGVLGVKPRPAKEIISYIGTGVRDLVGKSLKKDGPGLTDEGVEIFSEYYMRHAADEAKLYPHVKETLRYFKDKHKFILTNRFARFADITLKSFDIRKHFEGILGGDDENCKKPSACILNNMFQKLNIDRDKAMIVGDMTIDVETGHNAGIKTCCVTYGLGKIEEIQSAKPDYIIDDIIELERIIR